MKVNETKPNWSLVERRPPWGTVTSRELARILGVSLQTINNWHIRDKLPEPEPHRHGQGNKNRYKISKIRAWLENRPETDIHWEFIKTRLPKGFRSIEQAVFYCQRYWREFGIEKPV